MGGATGVRLSSGAYSLPIGTHASQSICFLTSSSEPSLVRSPLCSKMFCDGVKESVEPVWCLVFEVQLRCLTPSGTSSGSVE